MTKEALKLELTPLDMRLLCECARSRSEFWKQGLKDCDTGNANPSDYEDCMDEVDLEFFVERHEHILEKLNQTLSGTAVNEIDYLDEFQMFRPTQRVECIRLLGRSSTKVVFVLHTRHGSHFVYDQMEALVEHFLNDSEPKHRFESEAETEWFLKLWDLG